VTIERGDQIRIRGRFFFGKLKTCNHTGCLGMVEKVIGDEGFFQIKLDTGERLFLIWEEIEPVQDTFRNE